MKSLLTLATIAAVAASGAAQIARPVAVNDETVTKAIAGAVKYLYSIANNEGHWDPTGGAPDLTLGRGKPSSTDRRWGGKTALVLYALATASQQNDARFKKALEWLMAQEMVGTYSVSLRLQLIHQLTRPETYRRIMQRDAKWILSGARPMTNGGVKWDYLPPPGGNANRSCDFSAANYAVLALWAAGDERFEVPAKLWLALEKTYALGQNADGGWSYYPKNPKRRESPQHRATTGSMTTAGIASLYLIIDRTYARTGRLGAFRRSDAYAAIGRGLKWMADHFSPANNTGRPRWFETYYFYNCERVGAAGGMKFFGTHDWFRGIARTLLSRQRPNGSIPYTTGSSYGGAMIDTAFALLFLTKGSAPIIFNKLQHGGDWDNHLRDLAGLTDWLARQSERPANWQVVNLKVAPEELTDSRILYVAGLEALSFTAEEKAKLKRYVDLGGTLVFHPDGGRLAFHQSVRKLLAEFWPTLELSNVDLRTHPIGKIYVPLSPRVRLQQLATPTRVLAFVVYGNPASAWERRQHHSAKFFFDLGAALHYYVNDRAALRDMPTKLTYFAEPFNREPPVPVRAVTLARIAHGDDRHRWDPEPAAMELLARKLAIRRRVNCRVKDVTPAALEAAKVKVAHLTGVGALALSAKEWDAIDAWLKAGGTLIVDQAGGPPEGKDGEFDASFRKLIAARYGEDALGILVGHPALAGLGKVGHRNVMGVRRKALAPRLESLKIVGRDAVIYSRYDITCGLLGNPNPLVSGLDGDGAHEVFTRLLLTAAGVELN